MLSLIVSEPQTNTAKSNQLDNCVSSLDPGEGKLFYCHKCTIIYMYQPGKQSLHVINVFINIYTLHVAISYFNAFLSIRLAPSPGLTKTEFGLTTTVCHG